MMRCKLVIRGSVSLAGWEWNYDWARDRRHALQMAQTQLEVIGKLDEVMFAELYEFLKVDEGPETFKDWSLFKSFVVRRRVVVQYANE